MRRRQVHGWTSPAFATSRFCQFQYVFHCVVCASTDRGEKLAQPLHDTFLPPIALVRPRLRDSRWLHALKANSSQFSQGFDSCSVIHNVLAHNCTVRQIGLLPARGSFSVRAPSSRRFLKGISIVFALFGITSSHLKHSMRRCQHFQTRPCQLPPCKCSSVHSQTRTRQSVQCS